MQSFPFLLQLAVEMIKLVINLGLEYEDIENIAIEICESLMTDDGYRGDIICPGVVTNYGPHVRWKATYRACKWYFPISKEVFLFSLCHSKKSSFVHIFHHEWKQYSICDSSCSQYLVKQLKMGKISAQCTAIAYLKQLGRKRKTSTTLFSPKDLKRLTHWKTSRGTWTSFSKFYQRRPHRK